MGGNNDRKLNATYAGVQGSLWMGLAVCMAFITPILQQKGFSNAQIGVLLAVKSIATMISQIAISSVADRYASRIPLNYITAIVTAVAIAGNVVFWLFPVSFAVSCVLFFLFGSSTFCLSPLIDSMGMKFMENGRKLNYTLGRSAGSAMWAFACIFLGWLMKKKGADGLLVFHIIVLASLLFFLVRMENCKPEKKVDVKAEAEKKAEAHSIWYLLTHYPAYTAFVIAIMLCYMSSVFCNNYQIDVITKLGGDSTILGYAEFILAISEVPVVLFFTRLKKKIGIRWILVMSMLFCLLKVGFQSFAPDIPVFMVSQVLEMLGFGMTYSAIVLFVMDVGPRGFGKRTGNCAGGRKWFWQCSCFLSWWNYL